MNRTAGFIGVFLIALLLGAALGRSWLISGQGNHTLPSGPIASGRFITRTQEIMATPISVQADPKHIDQAASIVFRVFTEVDARMSEWRDTSPLSALNRSAGVEPVVLPPDLLDLLHRSQDIAAMTDGAFDPTWAALWGLWDFRAEQPALPADADIDARVALVDYHALRLDDAAGTAFLERKGMLVGLGGIAKGYALDQAATALRQAGIHDFLISGGGQVMAGGTHDGRPWRVGVRDPRGGTDDFFARIELDNESISTSGDYERYFIKDNVRYHHILDPRTGRPSRGVRTAVVIARDATLADALSTALMIVGVERGLTIVESLSGVEALMVDEQAQVHMSTGARTRVEMLRPPLP
ncbi:MAG: FAD:protein FMN transferase [Phycisphaerales bacterium]|nr:FAD:protein FMN transferase [Phycisphaerales bacterium]